MMLNTMVSNFFPFEGDLREKWPYKHRGKIMNYNQCHIVLGFRRSGHKRVIFYITHSINELINMAVLKVSDVCKLLSFSSCNLVCRKHTRKCKLTRARHVCTCKLARARHACMFKLMRARHTYTCKPTSTVNTSSCVWQAGCWI